MKNIFCIGLILIVISCSQSIKKKPVGVVFNLESIKRIDGPGDNWCITWAKDGSQITSMDDGNWLKDNREGYHNNIYKIYGSKDEFTREPIEAYPKFSYEGEGWFGYGVCSVDGTLYSMVSRTPRERWGIPFVSLKLLQSEDEGNTWTSVNAEGEEQLVKPWDEEAKEADEEADLLFCKEWGEEVNGAIAYPFVFCSFVQCGQDNSKAKDDYVYIYAPEPQSNHVSLVRVHKHDVAKRSEWEFFSKWDNDKPVWTKDILKRGPAHVFPEKNEKAEYFGWYSWLPSVVWNQGLGLYIMANGGTYAGRGLTSSAEDYYHSPMHTKTGSLGFWYSENPYGPWKQFYYTDYWIVDNEKNRTYQPKLSPKWISEDGTKMVLIWSDAMRNDEGKSHTVNYMWNQMEIEIQLNKNDNY